jgi:D-alanyl-D-alanine carboxypeptidase
MKKNNGITLYLKEKIGTDTRHFKIFRESFKSENMKTIGINTAIATFIAISISSINTNTSIDENISMSNNTIFLDTVKNNDAKFIQLSTSKEDIHSEKYRIKLGKELLSNKSKYPHYYHAYLEEYLDYKINHIDMSFDDVITQVNMGLYRPFYSFYTEEGYLTDNFACINKYTRISQYAYNSLYKKSMFDEINKTGFKLRKDASKECENMIRDAKKDGIKLKVASAYMSYDEQKKAYNETVNELGEDAADLIIERAGYSYGELGTKVVFNIKVDSKEEKWLKKNAYKYGFIYLFPKGKEAITGYTYNPGAFHYVGKNYAKEIYKLGITFDEYLYRYLSPGQINYSTDSEFTDEIVINAGKSKTYSRI